MPQQPPVSHPRLGAAPHDGGTTFAVFSGGEAVDLCLFDAFGRESRVPLQRSHDRWTAHVPDVGPGTLYGFRVHGPWDPWHGHRFNHSKLLLDPYARAVTGQLLADDAVVDHVSADVDEMDTRDSAPFVPRSVVVGDDTDQQADRRRQVPWTDTVVYELHVRGFTKRHPDVPEELRGTYAGLAHPAVLEHLLGLGVTTVELLPVQQHVPELHLLRGGLTNFWGYNTIGFFAPHAAYSSAGTVGQQVNEFRQMVRAFHDAGLEVVLDVVYNHTAEGDLHGPTLSMRGLDNSTYYRLRNGRDYEDVTGCGNTLDLRQPRTLALVADSLRYWVQEMHVDGFRFDLAPALARGSDAFEPAGTFLSVLGQDPVLSGVKLVAEPWDLGPGGYQLGHFPPPWAEWNDKFRDAVRQVWLGDNAAKQGSGVRDLAYRVSGSSDVFAAAGRGPLASVNFVTAHDGFTLHDLVTYEQKRNEANGQQNMDGADRNRGWNCGEEGPTSTPQVLALRQRMMRNLMATLLTSTGVPMLTAGDETGRTQLGNNNAYCFDDESTWVDWSWVSALRGGDRDDWRIRLLDWTRALVALRRDHPSLRPDRFFDGRRDPDGRKDLGWLGEDGGELTDAAWFDHDRQVIGCWVSGVAADEAPLLLLTNAGPAECRFSLPGPPWGSAYRCLLDTADDRPSDATSELAAETRVLLAPYSWSAWSAAR